MKLRRIRIGRMPGIDQPFELAGLDGGLNLVTGPNGSGKSTFCRAVRALLWPESEKLETVSLEGEWDDAGSSLRVEREHDRTHWLRSGADADAPAVPPAALARCFNLGVRDLLTDSDATDDEVARQILRQISGGYDLRQVQADRFATKPMAGKNEASEVTRLERLRRQSRLAQEQLAEREEQQQTLEAELASASRAGETLTLLQAAREVAEARQRLETVEADLADFPAGMDRLSGEEPKLLKQSEYDLKKAREDRDDFRETAITAVGTIEACRLPGGPLDEQELVAWSARVRSLRGVEDKLAAAEQELVTAGSALASAAATLDPGAAAEGTISLDRQRLESLDAFLRRAVDLGARAAKLRAAQDDACVTENAASRRDIDEGRERLAGWLAADVARRRTGLTWLWVVALLAAAAGVAAALTHHPAWWLLAAAGAGWLLLLAWLQLASAGSLSPAFYRRAFERLPLEPPKSWEATAVRGALRRLDADLAGIEMRVQKRAIAEESERDLRALEQEQAALEEQRAALRAELGVDPGCTDLDLAVLARRIEAHRTAAARRDEVSAAVAALGEERNALLEKLNGFLGDHDEPAGNDAAGAEAGLERLKTRSRTLDAAMKSRDEAGRQEARREEAIETLQSRIAELFRKAGLEPRARDELDVRLRLREAFADLTDQARGLRDLIAKKEPLLAGADELQSLSTQEVQERIGEVRELADTAVRLSDEIGSIRTLVAEARKGNACEKLLAQRDAAIDTLAQRRDERFAATAGSVLLEEIRNEYDRASKPEVLRRAEKLFAKFTGNRYALELNQDEELAVFHAVEASSGRRRTPAQLSEGTRIQLLLAVRLAFASGLDQGRRIPLFLDEVLTTSDPERFEAVARSLAVTVEEEGRQVFYLTSNPSDTARWNRVLEEEGRGALHAVDLGALRDLAAAASAEVLVAERPQEPPSPDGLDAAEYGLLLKVPPVDVDRSAGELHLFHLLNDDLPLLHRLVAMGVSTVGQWKLLAERGEAATLFGEATAARLSALAALYEAFLRARRIGRGRRVDMDALRRSGQVSAVYLEKFPSLVDDLDGDAGRLMETITTKKDERTKRFHATAAGQLREWLEQQGYLDEREPLDSDTVNVHVLAALAGEVEAKRLTDAEVARRVDALFKLSGG